jgi:polyisoprenoid-binding protein YceI
LSTIPNPIGNSTPVTSTTAAVYVIDPRVSRFTVRAFASGVLSAFGHNPNIAISDFAGEIHSSTASSPTLRFVAQASSLQVTDDISDKDRREIERQMHAEVLESTRYPEIVFECSRVTPAGSNAGPLTLDGELTLHGVTNPEKISAQVSMMGDTLRAFGDFALRQSDYGIRLVSALGGALKVKDELKFSFNIVARRQG